MIWTISIIINALYINIASLKCTNHLVEAYWELFNQRKTKVGEVFLLNMVNHLSINHLLIIILVLVIAGKSHDIAKLQIINLWDLPNLFFNLFGAHTGQVKGQGEILPPGNPCSDPLGACGPIGDCQQRCEAKHNDGVGSCQFGLCTCVYSCGGSQTTEKIVETKRKCTSVVDVSSAQCNDSCCNSKCGSQFNEGIGFYKVLGRSTKLCTCQYVCWV